MAVVVPNEGAAGQFNADQAEIDTKDFEIISSGLAGVGVISGCAVTAQGTPDMTVAVAAGVVSIAGLSVTVAGGNVTITSNTSGNPRYDLIVVDNAGVKTAVAGTTAANPVFPDIPADKVVLAAIYVNDTPGTITTGKIVDKRAILNVPSEWNFGAAGATRIYRVADGIVGLATSASTAAGIDLETGTDPGNPSAGTFRFFTKAAGSVGTAFFAKASTGIDVGPFGEFTAQMLYNRAQYGGFSVPLTSTFADGFWGLLTCSPTMASGQATTFANGADGRELKMETAATTGNEAGFSTPIFGRRNKLVSIFIKFKLAQVAAGDNNFRMFIGLSDLSLTTMLSADEPANGHYAGLTLRDGDTNFFWQHNDGGADAPTRPTTSHAATTGVYYMAIRCKTTSIEVQLYDSAMLSLHTTALVSELPTATVDMGLVAGIETLTDAVRGITFYYGNAVNLIG